MQCMRGLRAVDDLRFVHICIGVSLTVLRLLEMHIMTPSKTYRDIPSRVPCTHSLNGTFDMKTFTATLATDAVNLS